MPARFFIDFWNAGFVPTLVDWRMFSAHPFFHGSFPFPFLPRLRLFVPKEDLLHVALFLALKSPCERTGTPHHDDDDCSPEGRLALVPFIKKVHFFEGGGVGGGGVRKGGGQGRPFHLNVSQ